MSLWDFESASRYVHDFALFEKSQQNDLIALLNNSFPLDLFLTHKNKRAAALRNTQTSRNILSGSTQSFPPLLSADSCTPDFTLLRDCAVVFTAGGEGERLRQTLQESGVPQEQLRDFTKATYPLPGFYKDFGALQTNLALITYLNKKYSVDIPVVVTTGPAGSTTARIIPKVIAANNTFGLSHIVVTEQSERLHLTVDGTIACTFENNRPILITNPDETGGPIMKLKEKQPGSDQSILDTLISRGVKKILCLQATALYHPDVIGLLAAAAASHDGVGVGIARAGFGANDPYGTFVLVKQGTAQKLVIIEQTVRNDQTRTIKDSTGTVFLPYNTGLYAFDAKLLAGCDLPDYATPPKEVLPGLAKSPKIGYAATDILPFAKNPVVLALTSDMFAVIKTAEDLNVLSFLGRNVGLDKICAGLI